MMFSLIIRNVLQHARRYVMVLVSIVLGMGLLLAMLSIGEGLKTAIAAKAERFFGGHYSLQRFSRGTPEPVEDLSSLQSEMEDYLRIDLEWYPRVVADRSVSLLFEGAEVYQRRLVGVDWNVEAPRFGLEPEQMADAQGLVISDVVAARLGVNVGDVLTVLLENDRRQKNSFSLQVRAIVPESGLFAFSSYMDRSVLNKAIGRTDAVYDLGFSLPPGQDDPAFGTKLLEWLGSDRKLPMFEPVRNKSDISRQIDAVFEGARYLLVPYTVRLDQVNYIMLALDLIIGFVVMVFMLVMTIGIGNSYRMIVVERTREFGTMRAMGAQQTMVRFMILGEVLFLTFMGAVLGFLLSLLIVFLVSSVDLSGNGYLELLLVGGRLQVAWDFLQLGGAVFVLFIAGIAGVWQPSRFAAKVEPVVAMRQ